MSADPLPALNLNAVWNFLLRLTLVCFIPVASGTLGGVWWMANGVRDNRDDIDHNQLAIVKIAQEVDKIDSRVYQIESFANMGPRFTGDMNRIADARLDAELKDWARDNFAVAAEIKKMDAKLDNALTKQQLILENLAAMRQTSITKLP